MATFSKRGWNGATHRGGCDARVGDENELAELPDGRRGGRPERTAPLPPPGMSPLSAEAASVAAAPSEGVRACDIIKNV